MQTYICTVRYGTVRYGSALDRSLHHQTSRSTHGNPLPTYQVHKNSLAELFSAPHAFDVHLAAVRLKTEHALLPAKPKELKDGNEKGIIPMPSSPMPYKPM